MSYSRKVHSILVDMPRGIKQMGMIVLDVLVLPVMVVLAFSIRLGSSPAIPEDWWLVPLASLVTVIPLYFFGFYHVVIRHLDNQAFLPVAFSAALAAMALAASAYMLKTDPSATPRSVFIIYFLLATGWLIVSRTVVRAYTRWVVGGHPDCRPVAIFGSGSAGRQVAAALESDEHYRVVAFVDDDVSLQGSSISGMPVIGRKTLQRKVRSGKIEVVLLATPSVDRNRRMEIIRFLQELPVEVKSVPRLPDIISGKSRIEEIHNLDIEDLLGRDPVPPDEELMKASATGKCVLITGAGGSIGSELARQTASLKPAMLILLDSSEYALYSIESELRSFCDRNDVGLVCILESVTQRERIRALFEKHNVQTVYHAAAYKHVPIIEENEGAGFENNVIGTMTVAEEAAQAAVERFILISTDKAVRPTNVMGATKRVAELVVQALAERADVQTIFSIVRFGNVLGSSGSVVPLFRQQIREGGPLTVTHPEVVRYFMTIPEAAQLVIQAGAMAKGGEVFVLDMGEPVRIQDLARTMIVMMGSSVRDESNPNGGIEIVYTGLRPGEKLFEELLIGKECVGTRHPKIMQAFEERLTWEEIQVAIRRFENLVSVQGDQGVRDLLAEYVTGYQPAAAQHAYKAG